MKANMSRRSMLAGVGCAAAGSAVGQLLSVARAQEAAQVKQGQTGGICLTMIFEDGPKVKFDAAKYVQNHLPLLREVYGDSVERIEMRTAPEIDAGTRIIKTYRGMPVVRAATTFWIKDVAAFGQKLTANADRVNKDLDAVAKGNRLVQPDRIVMALGDAHSAVGVGHHVFSVYFRPAAGIPAFDQRYFTEVFLPKQYSLFGTYAVRGLEATVGMDQGGQKAVLLGAFHIFIRDRKVFEEESGTAFVEIQEYTEKLTQNTMAVFNDMRVAGIA
ncbi:MAG: hypothetical protein ABIQ86_00280 [Steroidobacteraceae bacterium]